ncbi:MAG: adenylate/guanylate cyclase domain-containing protein [Planctomycetes bacterium]|nr:adenylate/guanylate cyclase domain-containing protein [Planctomycetota bacterium]
MFLDEITSPTEMRIVVGLADITGFARDAQARCDRETFDALAQFYAVVGKIVESAGGRVVKFMGDGALLVFPPERARDAVQALKSLSEKARDPLIRLSPQGRLRVRAHVGTAICGPLGTATHEPLDIIGRPVMELFRMPSGDLVVSPELRRLLDGP